MCLPVSRLFWVSSLAYPNLLGTKGYVDVVVVVQWLDENWFFFIKKYGYNLDTQPWQVKKMIIKK
jgi:hypothetical protein